jgi:signal transduction histidine kinase
LEEERVQTIIDRLLLLAGGCFLLDIKDTRMSLTVILIAMAISEFNLALDWTRLYYVSVFGYLILCIIEPTFSVFLPLILYDALLRGHILYLVGGGMLITYYITKASIFQCLFLIFLVVICYFLNMRTKKVLELKEAFKQLKDTSTELNLVMEARNREIQENQDNQVHLATLRERNRIAREIHDNVGHMLTRSILMLGAFGAVNKDEGIKAGLAELKDTLGNAMNSIRESVHDLHDDSIDLHESIKLILKEFSDCEVALDYDMSKNVDRKVKLCFIAILKEACSNIMKHSNATRVEVALREHPGIYQLLIHDNGNASYNTSTDGIGLINMQDRVFGLKGTITITTEKGFRIFIMIPKQGKKKGEV